MTPHPPRRRGRPPIEEGMTSIEVSVSLTERDLRAVTAIAMFERVKEQEIIRRAVGLFLRGGTRSTRARRPQSITVRSKRIGL